MKNSCHDFVMVKNKIIECRTGKTMQPLDGSQMRYYLFPELNIPRNREDPPERTIF